MKGVLFAFAAASILLLACGGGEEVTPLVPEGAGSPAGALETVEIGFNERAIKVLASALSENFVFYFDPDDVGWSPPSGPGYIIPESWSYGDFWPAMYNIFKNGYSVYITIYSGRIGTPGEKETTYRAENVNICVIVMVNEINGYIADRGYCDYEFERYEAGGKKYWRLINWWDRTSEGYDANPGVEPTSLGRLLAIFY